VPKGFGFLCFLCNTSHSLLFPGAKIFFAFPSCPSSLTSCSFVVKGFGFLCFLCNTSHSLLFPGAKIFFAFPSCPSSLTSCSFVVKGFGFPLLPLFLRVSKVLFWLRFCRAAVKGLVYLSALFRANQRQEVGFLLVAACRAVSLAVKFRICLVNWQPRTRSCRPPAGR
jgi:hypothetical protein